MTLHNPLTSFCLCFFGFCSKDAWFWGKSMLIRFAFLGKFLTNYPFYIISFLLGLKQAALLSLKQVDLTTYVHWNHDLIKNHAKPQLEKILRLNFWRIHSRSAYASAERKHHPSEAKLNISTPHHGKGKWFFLSWKDTLASPFKFWKIRP